MVSPSPEMVYKEKIEQIDIRIDQYKKKDRFFGAFKLFSAAVGVLAVFRVFSSQPLFSTGLFGICVFLFIVAAVLHEAVIRDSKFCRNLKTVVENEIKILHYQFPPTGYTGDEFKDQEHNYTLDLDIFGEKGIYHYINRGFTSMGRRRLARWMLAGAEKDEITLRQQAVKELADKLDLRQIVSAHGLLIKDSIEKGKSLNQLLKEPSNLLNRTSWLIFMHLWPLVTLGTIVLIFFKVPWGIFLGFFLSQVFVNKIFHKKVSRLYKLTYKSHKILRAYSRIIDEIEKENFVCEKLNGLKQQLSVDGVTASKLIRQFSVLLEWFDTRHSSIHFLVNNILLWDLHCMYRIEKWIRKTGLNVPIWFDVMGEFEALSGFASLYFNNPSWSMPTIISAPAFVLETTDLGHPLIPPNERVCNDLEMNKEGQNQNSLLIVTGPNMAGKSTFLRTVGVNIVLALAGAPVCASDFTISPVKLFSSMKTSDSLDKHLSLFYAELQRLKMILDAMSRGEPVFFLIDEMLKGTNAVDRQKGAIALLKQLMISHANGIVATHDLKLTQLEQPKEWEQFPEKVRIANYHFDGYIEEDRLLFDYKLKAGICRSFNALVLMKKMGIKI